MNTEARYYKGPPTPQAALDIFRGEWACRMPAELGPVTAGATPAFENDPRVLWAVDRFAEFGIPVPGADVLELGPLEAAHTVALSRLGARSVTAIEANDHAFLKCLVVKELLGLTGVNFLFGDAVAYLRDTDRVFDIGFASGILYHSASPVEMIELLCRRSRTVFIWTHFWDPELNARVPEFGRRRDAVQPATHAGFAHTLHRHTYGPAVESNNFWGGPAPFAQWMEREEIAGALRHFGFTRQAVVYDENPNGSAMRIAAARG
jgi:hypothetical protein